MAGKSLNEFVQVEARDLADRINRLVAEGDVRRITLRQGEHVLLDIPLRPGVGTGVTTALLDRVPAIATIAKAVARCTIEVEREGEPTRDESADEAPLHAHIVRSSDTPPE